MYNQSSYARFNTERCVNENGVKERLKKVYGKMRTVENWKKFVLSACVVALAIDPLFLFIPEIDSHRSCFTFDKKLGKIVCVLRTFNDTFYVLHIIFSFIIEVIASLDRSQISLRDHHDFSVLAKAVIKTRVPLYLFVDIVSVLPIPQVVVVSLIVRSSSTSVVSKRQLIRFTKWIIVCQYIPRIIRIYPLYKEVTRTSATIAESNWAGAALNLFLFLMYSYVFGAFWYVNGVQKKSRCWRDACSRKPGCNLTTDLFCAKDVNNSRFLTTSCPLIDPDEITNASNIYDFGMYIEVLKSGVAEVKPRDFPRKFVYCFWWGLRNLSTFGQSLKPGNSSTDIFFAIIICASGLFLFAVLIGNVQKYMISTTVRVEEMKERQRDTEKWMSSRNLPEDLKERIRKYDNYKWREFRGTEEDALLRSLPKDLRLETKRHLYKNLLKASFSISQAPLPATMNDWLLEALCDRVKSVFYSANSCIVREGDPVEEMLIITKGEVECTTKSSDHYYTFRLKKGDVCGDLHYWILDPSPSPHLPTSSRTIMTVTDVEGFILLPDDLKFVASHSDRLQCLKLKEMFRSLSEQRQSGCSSSPVMLLPVPQRSDDPEFSIDEA